MKKISKKKKIIICIASIVVAIPIAIWIMFHNEIHFKRDITYVTAEEFFTRENVLINYELREVYRYLYDDMELAELFVTENGSVYYFCYEFDEGCRYSFLQNISNGVSVFSNSFIYLGELSTIDLVRIKYHLYNIDYYAETITCQKTLVSNDPEFELVDLSEAPDILLTDMNKMILERANCFLYISGENGIRELQTIDNNHSSETNDYTQTTDEHAIAAMEILLDSWFFEEFLIMACEDLYGENGSVYLEWEGR